MKLLWLGMVASDEMFEKMLARTIGQASAHVAQKSILEGIDSNGIVVDTISAHNYPSYPVYPNKNILKVNWSRKDNSKDVCIGFKNIKYVSHLSKIKSLIKEVRAWLQKNGNESIHIVVYSMHSPLLVAANYAKFKRKDIKIHLIVPDIPKYVDRGANQLKKNLKKIDWIIIKYLSKRVDKYILFTKQMATFLGLKSEKYIVVEGSISQNTESVEVNKKLDDDKIKIMYAGAVDKFRGIVELVDAFEEIPNPNYELWITGSGNAVNYIEKESKKDKRIKYFGYFADRSQVIDLEKKADILINTRFPDEEVSKYIFPSKIFEYMVTGNPVISIKVPGIPDEYFSYIIGLDSMKRQDIINAIEKIARMSTDERKKFGMRARNFILKEKNNKVQAKRIIDFIKS